MEPKPALLIVMAFLEEFRDRNGAEKCRDRGIGAIRNRIGRLLPEHVVQLPASRNPDVVKYVAAQRDAQASLRGICKICGGCAMSSR